jgi:hypothetical protein
MKYIFIVGAPGSKWSSVAKNIYTSLSVDSTDSSDTRTYNNDIHVNHCGAYWDPGMEFGTEFDHIDQFSRTLNEREFDSPFSGTGVRIIKSHCLANHIGYLKATWPDCPVVLVHRSDRKCLNWWLKAGGFDITYPNYAYYKDEQNMKQHIKKQNASILDAWNEYEGTEVTNNTELSMALGIFVPGEDRQDYVKADICVKVI